MSTNTTHRLTQLRTEWTTLYRTILPSLAKAHSPVQPTWPVVLDHCFARIILDNAVGLDRPWAEAVKAPAVKHMDEEQLISAIELGQMIATGERDLVELDERSLRLRGKAGKGKRKAGVMEEAGLVDVNGDEVVAEGDAVVVAALPLKKSRKGEMAEVWANFMTTKRQDGAQQEPRTTTGEGVEDDAEALEVVRIRIASDASMTSFRRHILTLLTQVPRGRYTTYKALSAAMTKQAPLSKHAPKHALEIPSSTTKPPPSASCARAVGSAMRNNPFAPLVPCHRVLAADGKIGGFGGDWGEDGRFVNEKRKLLRDEGVKFDGRGKVVGEPFVDFVVVDTT